MSDLLWGTVLITALALALFFATVRLTRSLAPRHLNWLALAAVAALLVYIRWLWYDVRLSHWLPVSNLIVVANWLPLLAAILAGVVWQRTKGTCIRRGLATSALAGTALYALIYPVLGQAPRCLNHWDWMGNCIQTTNYTCSPASAATLLKAHGISTSEQEMAELCLTRQGTSWQGLYRGLKLKTAGTQWDVEVASCSLEELRNLKGPLILSVGLDSTAPRDSEFTREFGWIPGVNHSVILHGFTPGGAGVIADPTQELCREQWDEETLRTLWRGYAIRLVERRPSIAAAKAPALER